MTVIGGEIKTDDEEIYRDLARQLTSPEDVLCLHAICQPVVNQMQNVVRFQRRQLDQCADAIGYLMDRLQADSRLANLFLGTESFTRLTAALAEIKNENLFVLREFILPGSGPLHRSRIYGPQTENNWSNCKDPWLRDLAWLRARAGQQKKEAA